MKVRISFTLDIDPEAWMEEFGTEPTMSRSEVRQDVVNFVRSDIVEGLHDRGVLK